MSGRAFLCDAHHADATEFCLCGQSPAYLCVTCVPQHADKSSHDVFSLEYLELFGALGNDKAELKRRIEKVKVCSDFLDKATASEAAIVTEADNLIADLVKCSQEWVEKKHLCFTTLAGNLRKEVSSLLQGRQVALSPLAQTLVERILSDQKEKNLLRSIPAENALKKLTRRGHEAFAVEDSRLQQSEYEKKVMRELSKLHVEILQAVEKRDAQKLILVLENKVQWFYAGTSQWKQLLALRRNIQVNGNTSSIFIPPNRILVCGGGPEPCTRHVDNRAYMLEGDGSVRELPPMSIGRKWPGVAWDSVRQVLYVFGGDSGRGTCHTVTLRASEMFLSEWSPLPDMHHARRYFNPCWYSSIVYLCGGFTNSVETYDPSSNTFVLQDFTLPESNWTTAVVENETLTVISFGYISKLQQGRLTSQEHEYYVPWSSCTPLVSEGLVYVYWNSTCSCINPTTGAVQKKVSLR